MYAIKSRRDREEAIREGRRFGVGPLSKEQYAAYLRGDGWQRRRRGKLAAAGYACEECGTQRAPLHVHHLHYCSLGREKNRDLKALCESCHKAQHPGWE